MPVLFPLLLLFAAIRIVGKFFLRRLGMLIVWLVLLLGILLVVLPALHAHAQGSRPTAWRVSQVVPVHRERSAHGVYRVSHATITIPPMLPPSARVVLAGDRSGQRSFVVDDIVHLTIALPGAPDLQLTVNCDRRDGRGVAPHGPIDLTRVMPHGQIRLTVALLDSRPPKYFSSALWLVIRQPQAPTAPGASTGTPGASSGGVSALPMRLGLLTAGLITLSCFALLVTVKRREERALTGWLSRFPRHE